MVPYADVACPACGHATRLPYTLLGAPTRCEGCGATTVPAIPHGRTRPTIRYEMSYTDFRMLIDDPMARPSVQPLLASWFAYTLDGERASTTIRDAHGHAVDPIDVHLAIQSDAERQGSIYRAAMTLWR